MTQTEIVKDSPLYRCGARCAERYSNAIAENVRDLQDTMGALSQVDYTTLTRIRREWVKGYNAVTGNPDGSRAGDAAWGRLFKLAFGVTIRKGAPRSASADAQRKLAARANAPADAPADEPTEEPITLTPDEVSLILAIRNRKDYSAILAILTR